MASNPLNRRQAILGGVASVIATPASPQVQAPAHPSSRWHDAAESMRQLALSWGDQGYGAVLVQGGTIVGYGPSRVIKDRDPDAHAERVAIRDAQKSLGREDLSGTVLYSTSRPCPLCEEAAARARVARMYFGSTLQDAGSPRGVAR